MGAVISGSEMSELVRDTVLNCAMSTVSWRRVRARSYTREELTFEAPLGPSSILDAVNGHLAPDGTGHAALADVWGWETARQSAGRIEFFGGEADSPAFRVRFMVSTTEQGSRGGMRVMDHALTSFRTSEEHRRQFEALFHEVAVALVSVGAMVDMPHWAKAPRTTVHRGGVEMPPQPSASALSQAKRAKL